MIAHIVTSKNNKDSYVNTISKIKWVWKMILFYYNILLIKMMIDGFKAKWQSEKKYFNHSIYLKWIHSGTINYYKTIRSRDKIIIIKNKRMNSPLIH